MRHMGNSDIVLYVDANIGTRNLLTSILEQNEFVVLAASNLEEAIRFCQEIHFSLALLNCPTPGSAGEELTAEIKFACPNVPILMISGSAAISLQDLAFVDAQFGPGTSLDDVIATMRRLLARGPIVASEGVARREWADLT